MPRIRILAALILFALGLAVFLVIDPHRASRVEAVAQFGAQQGLLARQAAHEVESYLNDCAQVLQFLSSFAAVQQRDRVRMAAGFRACLEPQKRVRKDSGPAQKQADAQP